MEVPIVRGDGNGDDDGSSNGGKMVTLFENFMRGQQSSLRSLFVRKKSGAGDDADSPRPLPFLSSVANSIASRYSRDIVWPLNLYTALRRKFYHEGFSIDCPIAVSARKLILQYCCLTGTIFPSDNGQLQEHHLLQLLSGIIPWIDPPDLVSKQSECGTSESEMLDGCRALLAMATVTSPTMFNQLLKSIRPFSTFTLSSTLMCEVIKVLMTKDPNEETWSWEARDILLDTWTALLMPLGSAAGIVLLPPEGVDAVATLFAYIVESELKAASASAFNDDSDSDYIHTSISAMDERLSSYALIGRAAIDFAIPLLTRHCTEWFSRLHQVPIAIQRHFADFVEPDNNPVVILCSSIIGFAEQSLNPESRSSFFSPRLMELHLKFIPS